MFLEVFLIGILAGISPGPDFFIVMKNSLGYGKKIGIASAAGIGAALCIHAAYTIMGLAWVLETYVYLFQLIQIAGAGYLAYLGIQAIRSTFAGNSGDFTYAAAADRGKSFWQGFQNGFLCNILNAKCFLFFLSVFSQFITADAPGWVAWVYGLEVVLAVSGWFVFLSVIVSSVAFQRLYSRCRKWVDRFFGGLLLYFSYKISKTVFGWTE